MALGRMLMGPIKLTHVIQSPCAHPYHQPGMGKMDFGRTGAGSRLFFSLNLATLVTQHDPDDRLRGWCWWHFCWYEFVKAICPNLILANWNYTWWEGIILYAVSRPYDIDVFGISFLIGRHFNMWWKWLLIMVGRLKWLTLFCTMCRYQLIFIAFLFFFLQISKHFKFIFKGMIMLFV